ncbi:hypothetical protein WOSG25_250140 [Weissella oryzae SG25]|uniref:Uncharacterized protein n=1 Tax=Weissella oryzae (strain DSM 25784 / JCM 18191 / LMG 30913 / SG25) TaxID=1329250 RepID=A0A069CXR1_WEIOS|nr:hypothetical protein [Weissella oryzae]GAK32043.1 hypothetical protein WOSG25_250140 [Weissella oryzae SG25]
MTEEQREALDELYADLDTLQMNVKETDVENTAKIIELAEEIVEKAGEIDDLNQFIDLKGYTE